jgi:spore coat protein CotH
MIGQRKALCLLTVVLAAAAWAATGADRGYAQAANDLFEPGSLHELRLFVNSKDLQQLRRRFDENTHYTADLQWRNLRVRNVGIRSRGAASRSATKVGLEVDFDRYTTGQRFLGLRSLVLDNLWQDPAMLRERIAMAFFERMGQPAPRESYARLFINNVYAGLYGVIEPVDSLFLARTREKSDGYLFEYKHVQPFHGEYLGDPLAPYKQLFEPRTHEREADTILYSPIRDLFREVSHDDDAVWRDRVEALIDVRQFVTHVAIEMFLSEPDGILGFGGMSNFYLYRPIDSTVQQLIPWDKDLALADAESSVLLRADENEVFRRLLAFTDLRTLYFDTLEACARSAQEDGWLAGEIAGAAALIEADAHADPLKPVSNDEFDAAVSELMAFGRRRPAAVIEEVARIR